MGENISRSSGDEPGSSGATAEAPDPRATLQPPGRAVRDPQEGPGLQGGSAAADADAAAEEMIGGGD